jgi:tRNA-splicing ligase RtcB
LFWRTLLISPSDLKIDLDANVIANRSYLQVNHSHSLVGGQEDVMPVKMILDQGRVPLRIYTDEMEPTALQQLGNIARLDLVHHHVVGMPDEFLGIGATVGAVIPTRGRSSPLRWGWISAVAQLP